MGPNSNGGCSNVRIEDRHARVANVAGCVAVTLAVLLVRLLDLTVGREAMYIYQWQVVWQDRQQSFLGRLLFDPLVMGHPPVLTVWLPILAAAWMVLSPVIRPRVLAFMGHLVFVLCCQVLTMFYAAMIIEPIRVC
jgi:hypothetical protein